MSLSITELSLQAGIPRSALRYYDRLGLLSSAGRADNGYRRYDDRALDRLRFIARAKELGCSLDEIATLLTAFDLECGDVQEPLRALIDGKIGAAQRRVAEMVALTAQLQEARHALSSGASEGPCGPACACLTDSPGAGVPLTVVQLAESDPAIACTLGHGEMADRIADWQGVLAQVSHRTPVENGIRLALGPDADLAEVARLARAEWACCSFFAFSVTVDSRGTALEVRAPGTARDLLVSVFGVAA